MGQTSPRNLWPLGQDGAGQRLSSLTTSQEGIPMGSSISFTPTTTPPPPRSASYAGQSPRLLSPSGWPEVVPCPSASLPFTVASAPRASSKHFCSCWSLPAH